MAPGCLTNLQIQNSILTDTIDSFEILEQTVIKQKKLAKKKKCDLRLRILLKRTFDLVCEIMDRENGFNNDSDFQIDNNNSINNTNNSNVNNYSNCSSPQTEEEVEEESTTTTTTTTSSNIIITTVERSIELIPLPSDDNSMVPDEEEEEKIDNYNSKEYHMLTNVQTEFFDKNFKRKYDFDDECDSSSSNNSNNKKLKLVDIHGSTTAVTKVQYIIICY